MGTPRKRATLHGQEGRQSPALFDEAFRGFGRRPWDGAREGKSLRQYIAGCHSGRTGWRRAGAYRQSLALSQRDRPSLLLIQECWSQRDPSWSLSYSENGAPATRSAKFAGVNPSTYRMPKSRRMLSTAVIGF